MIHAHEKVILEVEQAAQVALREAQEYIPFALGITTHNAIKGRGANLPQYNLEISLHYDDADSAPSTKTLRFTQQKPLERRWRNIFERQSHTLSYAETSTPDGDTQITIKFRRGKKIVYASRQDCDRRIEENHLNIFNRRALRRMITHLPGLTTEMIKKFGHDEPTQPLNKI